MNDETDKNYELILSHMIAQQHMNLTSGQKQGTYISRSVAFRMVAQKLLASVLELTDRVKSLEHSSKHNNIVSCTAVVLFTTTAVMPKELIDDE